MQVRNFRTPRRAVLFARLGVAVEQIAVRQLKRLQFIVRDEIMHGVVVAVAHLRHELRQRPVLRAPLDVVRKIAAEPPDVSRVLVERFKQRENFLQLLRRELAPVREIFQPHFLRAVLQKDPVQLHVVINVIRLLFARDAVKRRLCDIHKTLLHKLRHLAVEKRQ